MKKILLLILLIAGYFSASAQVSLIYDWKFSTGDSTRWADPAFNDDDWQAVSIVYPWELQGHPDYDGFGWYRLHLVIPSSLKNNSFYKDSVRFDMGYGDDAYAVYLNGQLVAKNYATDIKTGLYGPLNFNIAANDPAINWDKENLLAVRIFDSGGNGGMAIPLNSVSPWSTRWAMSKLIQVVTLLMAIITALAKPLFCKQAAIIPIKENSILRQSILQRVLCSPSKPLIPPLPKTSRLPTSLP
jgi:hypothetical protein